MPLLEGGEFLKCQRVDPAEGAQRPLRLAQAPFLVFPHVCGGLPGGNLVRVVVGSGDGRDRLVRSELRDEHLGVDAEFLDRLGLELLDPGELAGPGHLVAMGGVGEVPELVLGAHKFGP